MKYFIFAHNEHMALGGSEDCQGIFDNLSDALLKACTFNYENISIETIKDNGFITLLSWNGNSLYEKERVTRGVKSIKVKAVDYSGNEYVFENPEIVHTVSGKDEVTLINGIMVKYWKILLDDTP